MGGDSDDGNEDADGHDDDDGDGGGGDDAGGRRGVDGGWREGRGKPEPEREPSVDSMAPWCRVSCVF